MVVATYYTQCFRQDLAKDPCLTPHHVYTSMAIIYGKITQIYGKWNLNEKGLVLCFLLILEMVRTESLTSELSLYTLPSVYQSKFDRALPYYNHTPPIEE